MISDKMQQRLNQQINMELYASYLYLSMSAYCSSIALNGFAKWFLSQSEEERVHAMKIYDYILEQDGQINLSAIEQPNANFKSALETFENALAHEQKVTAAINDILAFANSEQDHATGIFLHWFVTEQIEEEATARDIVEQLKLVGDSGEGILMLDRELGSRNAAGE